ncbi:hypothetical protein JA1_000576 [Spathaspora sp. JA1]|nr:hypothetical protein JA1_000576 [Spathaspora sp. JA1]
MSLSDDILLEIFGCLNQINVCQICTVNQRLYRLGNIKLYKAIYCNVVLLPFQITAYIHTPLYTKYTVINGKNYFPWLNENRNIFLIKKIVFNAGGPSSDAAISLFPWIEEVIELESYDYGSYCSETQLASHSSSLALTKDTRIPESHQFQACPWVTRLVLSLMDLEKENLLAVRRLGSIREVEILCHGNSSLEKLDSVMMKHFPIKSLMIAFSGDLSGVNLGKIRDMFNLEIITAFQLRLCFYKYLEYLETDVTELIGDFSNLKWLAIISPKFDFEEIIKKLKPNSLHSLYLKLIQRGVVIHKFPVENILKHQEGFHY